MITYENEHMKHTLKTFAKNYLKDIDFLQK